MPEGNTVLKIDPNRHHTLVVVFLRGGADGLNMVVPVGDDAYYRARPLIGVRPGDTVALDDFFGLHPALAPLRGAYDDGELLVVHGAGSEESSRSHFEAQDFMEHGGSGAGGWLGRYLRHNARAANNPLASIAVGASSPELLRTSPATIVMESIGDIALGAEAGAFLGSLDGMYRSSEFPWAGAGSDLLRAMGRLEALDGAPYRPAPGVTYPEGTFGQRLRQVAQLVKAEVGVEAVTINVDGWDSHIASATLMAPLMASLSAGLMAFYEDLGAYRSRTTVAVLTEFGRRVHENASLGTDHGRGSAMFLLGGAVRGGRVLSEWAGLDPEHLEGPGDVPVRFNFRDVLAPVFRYHVPGIELNAIFPGYKLTPLEII